MYQNKLVVVVAFKFAIRNLQGSIWHISWFESKQTTNLMSFPSISLFSNKEDGWHACLLLYFVVKDARQLRSIVFEWITAFVFVLGVEINNPLSTKIYTEALIR